jgi:hypothetical protein
MMQDYRILKKRTKFVSSWRQQEQVEDDLSVQPELFTLENLQLHWKTFLPAVLKTMGLEIPNSTPDVEAIERFLEEKYNFFIDDIEHEKFFALMHYSQR